MLAVSRVSENRGAKGMIEVESGFSIPIFSEQAKTNPSFLVVHVQLGGKRGPIVSLAMEQKVAGASEPAAGAGEGGGAGALVGALVV
jgi:hypothetical protein